MTLVLDTGPVVAALNVQDPDHARCAALLADTDDLLIPAPILVEIDYWLNKLGGAQVWGEFVADITRGAYRLAHPTAADLTRAAELESTYQDLDLGLVDASIVALCERLGHTTLATLDRRHFSVVSRTTARISCCFPIDGRELRAGEAHAECQQATDEHHRKIDAFYHKAFPRMIESFSHEPCLPNSPAPTHRAQRARDDR